MASVGDSAFGPLATPETLRAAKEASRLRGVLDGQDLARMFAWMRPNDLIWNYWVNNYLLGRKPPPFDILFWNADTTRMTAGLHRDFLQLGAANALVTPGSATMLGSPVDLGAVEADSYIVAGITDHICPWPSCYRSTQLLGGRPGVPSRTATRIERPPTLRILIRSAGPPRRRRPSIRPRPDSGRSSPPGPARDGSMVVNIRSRRVADRLQPAAAQFSGRGLLVAAALGQPVRVVRPPGPVAGLRPEQPLLGIFRALLGHLVAGLGVVGRVDHGGDVPAGG